MLETTLNIIVLSVIEGKTHIWTEQPIKTESQMLMTFIKHKTWQNQLVYSAKYFYIKDACSQCLPANKKKMEYIILSGISIIECWADASRS